METLKSACRKGGIFFCVSRPTEARRKPGKLEEGMGRAQTGRHERGERREISPPLTRDSPFAYSSRSQKKKKRSRLPLYRKCKNHVKVNILPQWLLFWAGPHRWPSPAGLLFGPGPEFQRQCHLLPDPRMSPVVEKKDKFMQREGVSAVKCKLFKLEILCCFCLN